MSDTTPRLNLPLVGDHAQKRIVMNAGLMRLESLVQARALSRTAAAQPSAPADGDAYILPAGKTGAAWADLAVGDFVRYDSLLWEVVRFPDGGMVHVADENRFVVRDGGGWAAFEDAMAAFDGLAHIGINTDADATNVLALKGPAALMSAQYSAAGGTGDISLSLNKEAGGNSAQILLQQDWSTRAIVGLLGNDNLTVKVSADGAAFTTALSIDRTTGAAVFTSGSAAAPAVGVGSTDTGLYRADPATVGVSIGGGLRHSLASTGITSAVTGAASNTLALDGESSVSVRISRYSNDATGPSLTQRKARGSTVSPAVVLTNDSCGINQGVAHTGAAFVAVGNTAFIVTETTPSATAMGARYRLNLNAAGAVTQSEFMRMEHATGFSMFGANVVVDQNRNVRARLYTVATLPAASAAAGQRAQVSDAASPVFAVAVTGGGSTHCPVYSDGSTWRCG